MLAESISSDQCRATAESEAYRTQRLEEEIDFRREGLLNALKHARTKSDIDNIEELLANSAPNRFPEMKGLALSDLTDAYSRLRQNLTIDDAELRQGEAGSEAVDPWLLGAYPVDQVGFLYSNSPEQLDTLRLAARQELSRFRSSRLFASASAADFEPQCSVISIFWYLLSGGTSVDLRSKRATGK